MPHPLSPKPFPTDGVTVSVIIPARNEARHLPGLLDSIKGLDYPRGNLEVIVVDNGSTDRTPEIAESFGARVLRDDTGSVAGLRNLGARHATGGLLAFVDADCIVSRDWLKTAAPYYERHQIAAWGAPPVPPDDSTWVQRTWYVVRRKEKSVQEVDWLESMNLFVRKEQFLSVDGFNEALATCEDVDLCYRMARFGKILADAGLEVIHKGEARTLGEFVRKETWRGQSNLHGLWSHGLSLKEIPSLAVPLYYGIFLPASALACAVFRTPQWLAAFVLACLLPPAAALYRLRGKRTGFLATLQLLVLLHVYFYSRTKAVLRLMCKR